MRCTVWCPVGCGQGIKGPVQPSPPPIGSLPTQDPKLGVKPDAVLWAPPRLAGKPRQ